MKKKIIFISPLPPPFMGPTIATRIILNSHLKDSFELVHLDSSDHRNLETLNKIDFMNIFLALKHYLNLIFLIFKNRPDAVYIPLSQTTIGYLRDSGFILISKLFNKKVICHLRGGNFRNWLFSSGAIVQRFVKFVHSFVDGQIVLGQKLRNLFDGVIDNSKIFVVPNGLNFVSVLDRKESDMVKILFLSNFLRNKGILDFLYAIPGVCNHSKKIEFIFAGNWVEKDTREKFKSFCALNSELPVKTKVPAYDKKKLLESSDIFVFPPRSPEGHPWAVVEAMAAGLPIITTDQGAITESVKDGINGFIVKEKNPKQIAEKIKFLIDHPDIRKKMGDESRRLYLENFTEEKMTRQLSYAFHSVLYQRCAD